MKVTFNHNSWVIVPDTVLWTCWCSCHIVFRMSHLCKTCRVHMHCFPHWWCSLCLVGECSYKPTRLDTWMIFVILPWDGEGCLVVRTGSSMVTHTPEFCWLMERRTTLSLGVTKGKMQRWEEWPWRHVNIRHTLSAPLAKNVHLNSRIFVYLSQVWVQCLQVLWLAFLLHLTTET